jgi:dephospho-CoA kinase
MAFQYAIALTGGIASGKSSVASLLSLYGFRVINLDKITHLLLDRHSENIAEMFGSQFVEKGKVLRKKLGEVIFSDRSERKRLEEFIHPLIYREAEIESQKLDEFGFPYLIEIPLFFETKRYPIDRSIVVYTPRERQLERVISRDSLTPQMAEKRIDAQMSIEEKRNLGTYIIDNSGTLKELQREIERVADEVKRDSRPI